MQVENDSNICRECLGDVEGWVRRLEVVRGLDVDVDMEVEVDLEEVKRKRRVEGQELGGEVGEGELGGQPIEKLKHTQCDISRVCDPVVVKKRNRG